MKWKINNFYAFYFISISLSSQKSGDYTLPDNALNKILLATWVSNNKMRIPFLLWQHTVLVNIGLFYASITWWTGSKIVLFVKCPQAIPTCHNTQSSAIPNVPTHLYYFSGTKRFQKDTFILFLFNSDIEKTFLFLWFKLPIVLIFIYIFKIA